MTDFKHLFGPVPSRRFGRSLGVDLVPFKTCSFDCIFCQLGRTTNRTVERREYIRTDDIKRELDLWFQGGAHADYITLAGSGEPTLHTGVGELIDHIHGASGIPAVVLTNGALLSDPHVCEQVARADVVKVSLSAWDNPSLKHINRPHPDITFDRVIAGQQALRQTCRGEIWLEVFLVWGSNSTPGNVARIADWVSRIAPDKVQLNTAVRPPCEDYAYAVPGNRLEPLARIFDPPAEIVPEYKTSETDALAVDEEHVVSMLRRRPCTLEQIARTFGIHRNEAAKYVGRLTRSGRIHMQRRQGNMYYTTRAAETPKGSAGPAHTG